MLDSVCPRKHRRHQGHSAPQKEAQERDLRPQLPLPSRGQACGDPGNSDAKPPAPGGANRREQRGSHLPASPSRCERFILPLGLTMISPVSVAAFGVPLPSWVQPPSPFLLLFPLLLSTVLTSPCVGGCDELLAVSRLRFPYGHRDIISSLEIPLASRAPASVPVLGGPIKRGPQLGPSTEHSWVLKLLGSAVSAPRTPLLRQDHEALHHCPLSARGRGRLLPPRAPGTQ